MAIKVQSSFAAGELDPALHERTTLDKYSAGLSTGRNVVVRKTGGLASRPGRRHFTAIDFHLDVDHDTSISRRVKIHTMAHNGMFLEWGHRYVKIYSLSGYMIGNLSHDWTEDDLDYVTFADVGFNDVMIFRVNNPPKLLNVSPFGRQFVSGDFFDDSVPDAPTAFGANTPTGTPGGYNVDYAFTLVKNGQESPMLQHVSTSIKLPVGTGQANTLRVTLGTTANTSGVTEMRVYRRPNAAGAYGYIGSSTYFTTVSGNKVSDFTDYGQTADYTHSPPTYDSAVSGSGFRVASSPYTMGSRVGIYYQQRLMLSYGDTVVGSRTGNPLNFYRDYPYGANSAISFRGGSSGFAEILYFIEEESLIVFTTHGVYVSEGALTPSTLNLDRKGKWVIDIFVPPISIPGGILFVDSLTNTVRQLVYSEEAGGYLGLELSILSDHLFSEKRITSWAFQDGELPLLWVTFNDGTAATFTYEREHEMRAWTRHDSYDDIEYVASTNTGYDQITDTDIRGELIFVVNRDGTRYIEFGLPRYALPEDKEDNPEYDKGPHIAAMDAVVSWSNLLNENLNPEDEEINWPFQAVPLVSGEWDGPLTLTDMDSNSSLTSPGPGAIGEVLYDPAHDIYFTVTARASNNSVTVQPDGFYDYETDSFFLNWVKPEEEFTITPNVADTWDGTLDITSGVAETFTGIVVGDIIRWFNPDDRTAIDLEVTVVTDTSNIQVTPSEEFPSTYSTGARLYLTKQVFDGLDHLEGKDVAIMADGYILASPNNNIDNYPTVTVTGGEITLPNDYRGAIVHIGLPYTSDVETLDIDTVEQRPVLVESMTVNKLYVKVHNTRSSLYIGSRFPANGQLEGLDATGKYMVKMENTSQYDVDYEEDNPILANRYDQPVSKRIELTLPGDWKTQGRICIRNVDPVHFEILSIIPDLDDMRR